NILVDIGPLVHRLGRGILTRDDRLSGLSLCSFELQYAHANTKVIFWHFNYAFTVRVYAITRSHQGLV
ncbi:hypothetical protein AnigIFM63604_009209, partial [Aspergillus niger]